MALSRQEEWAGEPLAASRAAASMAEFAAEEVSSDPAGHLSHGCVFQKFNALRCNID
jgi:hypothetical protein